MPTPVGEALRLPLALDDLAEAPQDATAITWTMTAPDGVQASYSLSSGVAHDALGQYHLDVTPAEIGVYRWRAVATLTSGVMAVQEGTFEVSSVYEGAVLDLRDLRVLIPACRRAINGPSAATPLAPATALNDQDVLGLVADATGELILNTASADGSDLNAFGNQLVVVARDPYYMAPVSWATDKARSTAQDAAILSQAALNYYFQTVRLLKVTESMKNEAVEWSYGLSANVIAAWMQYLIANRDKAIAALQTINVVMDVYVSLVAERDKLAAVYLEPYVSEVGAPVPWWGGPGGGFGSPDFYDWRFTSWS